MKTLHPDLQTHLENEVTTVCFAWTIARTDGVTLGFTEHNQTLEVAGISCEPETGFTAGAAEASLGLAGDISDASGVLSSAQINETDIERGLYDGAQVALHLVNWQQPDTATLLRRFHIGEIEREGVAFRVELRSLSAALDQPRGRFFTRHCDAQLGDARCGFDLEGTPGFTAIGTVAATDGLRIVDLAGIGSFGNRWFDFGQLRFETGLRAGDSLAVATVRSLSGAPLVRTSLREPMGVSAAVGDAVTLVAGCDKSFASCKAKFANHLNFRGFPHMPGDDRALTYANADQLFDGGALVP